MEAEVETISVSRASTINSSSESEGYTSGARQVRAWIALRALKRHIRYGRTLGAALAREAARQMEARSRFCFNLLRQQARSARREERKSGGHSRHTRVFRSLPPRALRYHRFPVKDW